MRASFRPSARGIQIRQASRPPAPVVADGVEGTRGDWRRVPGLGSSAAERAAKRLDAARLSLRFFLLYPERRTPGGGHKQMRILALNLRQLGVESFLLRERSDDLDDNRFYGLNVPTADFALRDAARYVEPSDVLLLLEIFLERSLRALSGAKCRRAVYAQGGFLALLHRPRRGYACNGIEFMIGVSPYIAALGPRYLGVPPHRSFFVPYPVVRGPFADAVPS